MCPDLHDSSHSPKPPRWGRIGNRGRNDASEPPAAVGPPCAARASDAAVTQVSGSAGGAVAPDAGGQIELTETGGIPPTSGGSGPELLDLGEEAADL